MPRFSRSLRTRPTLDTQMVAPRAPATQRQRVISLSLLCALLLILAVGKVEAVPPPAPPIGVPDQAVLVTTGPAPAAELLTVTGDGYLSPVTAAPRPFTHMLLRWEAIVPVSNTLSLEVRASRDGTIWTPWGTVIESDDLWEPADGEHVFWGQELYAGEGARFWQVRAHLTPASDGGLPELRRVEVNTVDARFGPANPTADTPAAPALTEGQLAAVGRPPVVSRMAWGSPDGQGSQVAPAYRGVTHLVLHHTADANNLSPGQHWADRVRAIWSFHTYTRDWGDIGYNYLIDPNGVIYEGRAGGDNAVGFHDTANYGSMGVALIGSYTMVEPQSVAIGSLVELLAWKSGQQDIDPLGRSFYYGCSRSTFCEPFNAGSIVPNIAGHRQVTPGHTTCPGDRMMALLPSIRQRVAARLGGAQDELTARLELLGVRYERESVPSGELLNVTFTVKNSGSVAIEGQAPEATSEDGYVYDEAECFLGDPNQSYPTFPKETGRFRVLLGPAEAARQPVCAGETGGYPWRWGLNGRLNPGETREIVGSVRLRTAGPIALQAGAISEYVSYMAQGVAAKTVTVTAEDQMPAPAAYDEHLRPLAHVYRLGEVPDNLLTRTTDATAGLRGAYAGSFPWQGELLAWGEGGPLKSVPGLTDRFVVEQTRAFVAPVSGEYTFELTSDDSAWLWVDGTLVVSRQIADRSERRTGTVRLEAGRHVLAVKMVELTGSAKVGYGVRPPDGSGFEPVRDGLGIGERLGATFRSLERLTLVADDMGGVGVSQVRVALDGGPWAEAVGPIANLSPIPDGTHTIRYMAIDAAGNASEERTLTVHVDPNMTVYRVYLPAVRR